MKTSRPKLILLVGPSACGKTVVANHMVNVYGFKELLSTTTRPKRVGEVEGSSYNFIPLETFKEEEFIEYVDFNGHKYGLHKDNFLPIVLQEKQYPHYVLVVEERGAKMIYDYVATLPHSNIDLSVVYMEVSNKILLLKRMIKRGDSVIASFKRLWYDRSRGKLSIPHYTYRQSYSESIPRSAINILRLTDVLPGHMSTLK